MTCKTTRLLAILTIAATLAGSNLLGSSPALAQDEGKGGDASAQANNPLANLVAFNIQNFYIGEFTESDDDGFQTILRYAQPFSIGDTTWLFRGSAPFKNFPTPPDGDKAFGLGDVDAFAAYLFDTGNPAISFGLGPQATFPSATDEDLGSEKWSAGLTNVLFDARSKQFQYGYLATYQHSFAGDDGRDEFNVGAFQPFGFFQLGEGWYLRAAPIWIYNFDNNDYSVPVAAGVGKVIRVGDKVFNFFAEPQYSVLDEGPGFPEWQIFFSLNMQFY